MDAIGVWVIVLVILPFLLFFCRILLMAWNSVLLSKRIKNLSADIELTVWPSMEMDDDNTIYWPVPTYPPYTISTTEPIPIEYSYDVYSYIIVVFVLISVLSITKVAINRRRNTARTTALRDARARQQVSTISGSVDANSIASADSPSTSHRAADGHIKIDLPPTYDEVMKTFLDAKAAAAASNESSDGATAKVSSHALTEIDLEEPPPPQYNSIQSS